jgi:hypothetical protein
VERFISITVVLLLAPIIVYFLMRVASSAYFREKLNYQRTLIEDVNERGDLNDHESERRL